jgi:hypothetical protein
MKKCPFKCVDCIENECAIFDEDFNGCSLLSISKKSNQLFRLSEIVGLIKSVYLEVNSIDYKLNKQ